MTSELKTLFSKIQPAPNRKDKLAQTKLRERELHDARRAELQSSKQANAEKHRSLMAALRQERVLHDTKRASKDKREAERRRAHASTGQACEHGVWRCKICFPYATASA